MRLLSCWSANMPPMRGRLPIVQFHQPAPCHGPMALSAREFGASFPSLPGSAIMFAAELAHHLERVAGTFGVVAHLGLKVRVGVARSLADFFAPSIFPARTGSISLRLVISVPSSICWLRLFSTMSFACRMLSANLS